MKPFLRDKCTLASKTYLKHEVISDDQELAKIFPRFFKNAVDDLGINECENNIDLDIIPNSISRILCIEFHI